ncbi:MAG: trimethylamine methyltransferase family protein [Candidatus Heimdallarchaeota archaeon]
MRTQFQILSKEEREQIYAGALQVLRETGILIKNENAMKILKDGGVEFKQDTQIAHFTEELVRDCIRKVPNSVKLYDRQGTLTMTLGGDNVHYWPGSTAMTFLDSDGTIREPMTDDLIRFIQLTDELPFIHAQSTSIVPSDIDERLADRYRLYLVLKYAKKPVDTGAFTTHGVKDMKDMLVAVREAYGEDLSKKPLAVFDVCPSPPLMWSEQTAQHLIDCAHFDIPAEYVSMPLAGATGPASIAGALVQHTAETLSGVVLSQLTKTGAPVIWGGSPAVFDQREGTTPMGALETMMIDCAYAEIGKSLGSGFPTHAYMGLSDAKTIDAQTGFEAGLGIVLATLAGINAVAGPGMLNFESCQSLEKLVIDNEICGMAQRFVKGVEVTEESLAASLFKQVGPHGDFLTTAHTLKWFRRDQFLPSEIIDRKDLQQWNQEGALTITERAKKQVTEILATHIHEPLPDECDKKLKQIMRSAAERVGVSSLPHDL